MGHTLKLNSIWKLLNEFTLKMASCFELVCINYVLAINFNVWHVNYNKCDCLWENLACGIFCENKFDASMMSSIIEHVLA